MMDSRRWKLPAAAAVGALGISAIAVGMAGADHGQPVSGQTGGDGVFYAVGDCVLDADGNLTGLAAVSFWTPSASGREVIHNGQSTGQMAQNHDSPAVLNIPTGSAVLTIVNPGQQNESTINVDADCAQAPEPEPEPEPEPAPEPEPEPAPAPPAPAPETPGEVESQTGEDAEVRGTTSERPSVAAETT